MTTETDTVELIDDDTLLSMIYDLTKKGKKLCESCDWDDMNFCHEAVQWNGLNLKHVKKQIAYFCKLAVQQNGLALQYVKRKTPEICLLAVEQNGMALEFVNKQNPDICYAALCENPESFKFIKDQHEGERYIQYAIEGDPYNIRYLHKHDPHACIRAIDLEPSSILELYNPAPELCLYAIKKDLSLIGCVFFDKVPEGPIKDQLLALRTQAILTFGDDIDNENDHWFVAPHTHTLGDRLDLPRLY